MKILIMVFISLITISCTNTNSNTSQSNSNLLYESIIATLLYNNNIEYPVAKVNTKTKVKSHETINTVSNTQINSQSISDINTQSFSNGGNRITETNMNTVNTKTESITKSKISEKSSSISTSFGF